MPKAEDITQRVPVPRLRTGVIDDSIENQILLPEVKKDLERLLHRADEEDTRRIRKV
jgi:hypothetical protein